MPHPDRLPDLFIDRSLGRIRVPELLRDYGLRLVTLAERYGVPQDEDIADTTWLSDAGRRREVVLMKDDRIRYNQAEKEVVREFEVRCFCLKQRNLRAPEMAERFLRNIERIADACEEPGPFVYAVHQMRIERLRLG